MDTEEATHTRRAGATTGDTIVISTAAANTTAASTIGTTITGTTITGTTAIIAIIVTTDDGSRQPIRGGWRRPDVQPPRF